MTAPALIVGYHPTTKLADISWHELPPPLQETCEHFIDSWWNSLDPDMPLEASSLADMTVAEVRSLHQHQTAARINKRYHLITFMRIEPEDDEPLTYEDACAEKDQQELMCPENIHRIEEV